MTRPPIPTAVLGAACAAGAALCFAGSDAAIKSLSDRFALHQVIALRSLVALALFLAVMVPLLGGYRQLRSRHMPIHLARATLVLLANMAFFLALADMPLADATAIFFVSPLLIAALAFVFLGERVGPWRWLAILIGLAGVMVIVQPGSDSFRPVALLPLLAAVGYASTNILTRHLGLRESAITMAFHVQLIFMLYSLLIGAVLGDGRFAQGHGPSLTFLFRAWAWPQAGDAAAIIVAGLGSALGSVLVSQAYRSCEAALVAPLEYLALPGSVLLGLVYFNQWPQSNVWIGIGLIVFAGLFMIYRETRAGKPELTATKTSSKAL